jgi:hypothetical protein
MYLELKGTLIFDPEDKTRKHLSQASWKKVAMIQFEESSKNKDICDYYRWFIEKRYNLTLNKPLRGAHVTIINDRYSEMNGKWEEVKELYNGKEFTVTIDLDARTDAQHWWLRIPEKENAQLQEIRTLLGLGKPFFAFHMTIGHANERNLEHSQYIHTLINKFGGNYN